MRALELEALVAMGVFKDLQAMNDREMFAEYDKMLKQSTKVRRQYPHRIGLHDRKKIVKYSINNEEDAGMGEEESSNHSLSKQSTMAFGVNGSQ